MAKLDLNLDACRQMSQILHRIRRVIREDLKAQFPGGFEAGLPPELQGYLQQRQERESSIDWDLIDPSDLLEYAGFSDLFDIVQANPALLARFSHLASNPTVLHIRFLELQTIQNRVSYARPVSEADLGFLISFEERLKKSLAAADAPRPERPAAPPVPVSQEPVVEVQESPPGEPRRSQPVASRPAPVSRPVPPEPTAARPQGTSSPPPAQPRPPEATATPSAPAAPATPGATPPPAAQPPQSVAAALEARDDAYLLDALYREVTQLADALSTANPGEMRAHVWEQVRESDWYTDRFTALALRPVSDFFELFEAGRQLLLGGASKSQLQDYLKERNFPKVVLSLRPVFRPRK